MGIMGGYDATMGRPPLNVKSTNVRLPVGLGERIGKPVGHQRRAAFIREVLEREVERLESEQGKAARSQARFLGAPATGITHTEATVPGVGYHPEHSGRAWQAVLDLFSETLPDKSHKSSSVQYIDRP